MHILKIREGNRSFSANSVLVSYHSFTLQITYNKYSEKTGTQTKTHYHFS